MRAKKKPAPRKLASTGTAAIRAAVEEALRMRDQQSLGRPSVETRVRQCAEELRAVLDKWQMEMDIVIPDVKWRVVPKGTKSLD
jgi:hypothetical protein